MEKIKKETFLEWVKKHDWMQIQDAGTKAAFLSPTGNIIMVSYTVSGDLENVALPMPMLQPPQGKIMPFSDFKGGTRFDPFQPP